MRSVRVLAIALAAALLMLGSTRALTFAAPAGHPVRTLAPWFTDHPVAMADRAMTEIGAAAAIGQPVPETANRTMAGLARRAPLSTDPFLVEATIAQMAGDGDRAERLLLIARHRDPRSQGVRYFLADRYLKTGRVLPGLVEMGVLARLSETASQSLVPALAAYARSPGAIEQLRAYFARAPAVRDSTLSLLAGDARNKDLVLALAPARRAGEPPTEWQGRLVEALVLADDYRGAEGLWSRFAGVRDRGLLFNPQFRRLSATPPFNWAFQASGAGVAEPADGGGLDVVYYGREEATLAKQVLLLKPGAYRLSIQLEGSPTAAGLVWTLNCLPEVTPLTALPLGPETQGKVGVHLSVPTNRCRAQVLELRGRPSDVSRTVEARIIRMAIDPKGVAS